MKDEAAWKKFLDNSSIMRRAGDRFARQGGGRNNFGLREYTTILSGTSPTGDTADMWAVFMGMTYIVLYFAFVLGVPILIIASVVFSLVQIGAARARISRRKCKAGPQEPASEKPSSTAAQ